MERSSAQVATEQLEEIIAIPCFLSEIRLDTMNNNDNRELPRLIIHSKNPATLIKPNHSNKFPFIHVQERSISRYFIRTSSTTNLIFK